MTWLKGLFISVCVFLIGSSQVLVAQRTSGGSADTVVAGIPQKDIGDVWKSLKKKNAEVKPDSLQKKASNKAFIPLIYPGYALVTGFQLVLTTNLSFYADDSKDRKI